MVRYGGTQPNLLLASPSTLASASYSYSCTALASCNCRGHTFRPLYGPLWWDQVARWSAFGPLSPGPVMHRWELVELSRVTSRYYIRWTLGRTLTSNNLGQPILIENINVPDIRMRGGVWQLSASRELRSAKCGIAACTLPQICQKNVWFQHISHECV